MLPSIALPGHPSTSIATTPSESNGHHPTSPPPAVSIRTTTLTPPLPSRLPRSRPPLPLHAAPPNSPIMPAETNGGFTELKDESDFDALLSPDGCLSVCGFGSLLSERSARSTFPELKDFRVARLRGFRRVFGHSAPVFFERGIANPETGEIASLSAEPCEGEFLIVTVFEIERSEIPAFIEREHEFRFLAVTPENLNGISYNHQAVVCARYSDEEYFHIKCKGSREMFDKHYGRYNIQKIWRDDILPCRLYLRHCVLAAKHLSNTAYDNFLDHTFLGDRKTTIRQYLSTTGSGIMEEEPPESLKTRYGG